MNIHCLGGCSPTPLAYYLKALGILRLVSEQADPKARGWWDGERFMLATVLSESDLEDFFLNRYEPTPMFNPWGARSGFFKGGSEKNARNVLRLIEQSNEQRFRNYSLTIKEVRKILNSSTGGEKPGEKDKERKMKLMLNLRNQIRGTSSLWLNTVAAVVDSGERKIEFPALFGTGGSEGSGSYTSAYMQALEQCLFAKKWDQALPSALSGKNETPGCVWSQSMGQFVPDAQTSPWEIIFAFEGACVVSSAVSTRSEIAGQRWISSPFYFAPTSYGYFSGSRTDSYILNKGKEMPGRGEQWFPLWQNPMLISEIVHIFSEGRAFSQKNRPSDGWGMARAISSLGVKRGIKEFVRFGYLQRNNLATHFAVPLGRFLVPDKFNPILSCLDDLDLWLSRLKRECKKKHSPVSLQLAERKLSESLFTVSQNPIDPGRWQALLIAISDVEGVIRFNESIKCGYLTKLRPLWVKAADDGSPEFRLAVSCALQFGVRRFWIPPNNNETSAVVLGRNGLDDSIAIIKRSIIESRMNSNVGRQLIGSKRAFSSSSDLATLISGQIDLNKTMAIARALMSIDHKAWNETPCPPEFQNSNEIPDASWLVIRLAMLPFELPDGNRIGVDPAILRRLENGDAQSAVSLALRRLNAAGIKASVRFGFVSYELAKLWAAALAFPISSKTANFFIKRIDPNY